MRIGLLWTIVVLVCTSCVSFKTVEEVGKTGQKLADFKTVNQEAELLCASLRKTPELGISCDELRRGNKGINVGIDLVVEYNTALLSIIGNSGAGLSDLITNGVKLGNQVKLADVTDTQLAGAQALAKNIQNLVTGGIKQRVLSKEIQAANPAIDQVCSSLLSQIQLHQQTYRNYLTYLITIENANEAIDAKASPGDPIRINAIPVTLLLSRRYIGQEQARLEQLKKIVQAYSKAHAVLAQQTTRLGKPSEQKAIANEIINSLKGIIDGIDKLKSITAATTNP